MSAPIKNTAQGIKRTWNFFVNSAHFPTIFVTVAVVGAALFFANITPASLPEPAPISTFEQETARYLTRLAQTEEAAEATGSDHESANPWPTSYTRVEGSLQNGDTLSNALRRGGIEEPVRSRIIGALTGLLDFRSLRPRDRFTVVIDESGDLVEYHYEAGPLDVYRVQRTADNSLQAEKVGVSLERRTKKIAGEVTSSLFAAFQPHGESPRLVYTFADIFASHIDFNVETRAGDRYSLVFEKYYKNEEFVGYGRLLSASYQQVGGEVLEAFHYESAATPTSYFDRNGNELGASFLRSPVPMARVTSGFTYRRQHPILNVVRPHLAIDLAAPEGTPVMATADGRVVFRAMNGGNGNMVTIDHGNGYRSFYAHLSGFRRGLKVGDRVRQKDLIGYVGSTGLATGPHVCYRIQHHGQYVNPLALKFKPRSVLAGAELAAFSNQIQELTSLAQNIGAETRVLKVRNITLKPEERLTLL